MSHILRVDVDSGGITQYRVGHYTQEGGFNTLRLFKEEQFGLAVTFVNYLNGGLGIPGPDVDFVVAAIKEAIYREKL